MKVVLTRPAAIDLEAIGDWIAHDNQARAVTFVEELRQRAASLARFPNAGPPRPQWGEGVRIAVHGRYLVIYRVRNDTVQVLRILHGARDLDRLLSDEPLPE